jgi:hypothetical protein
MPMMPRRRPDLPTGVEEPVPYDQTGLMGADTPPDAGPAPMPGGAPAEQAPMDLGAMAGAGQPQMDLGSMGQPSADPMGLSAPAPVGDLAPQSPEDAQVAEMAAALDDPNVDPMTKQQIEQQLQLAARRQLAGMGG